MVIFSALALLAFAACGGDDDDDSGGEDATATASQADGGDDGGDSTPTDDAGDDSGDDGGSDDPFADLDQLTAGLDQVTGQASYEVDNDGEVSTMTFYSDPPNSRYDITDESGDSSIVIYTADTTYSCTTDPETCIDLGTAGGGLGGLGFLTGFFGSGAVAGYAALAEAGGYAVETSSEEYGGVDASCYSWTDPSDDQSSVKFCFAESGVMVYEEIRSSGSVTRITATEYSDSVDSGAFDPPYDVTELPGG